MRNKSTLFIQNINKLFPNVIFPDVTKDPSPPPVKICGTAVSTPSVCFSLLSRIKNRLQGFVPQPCLICLQIGVLGDVL